MNSVTAFIKRNWNKIDLKSMIENFLLRHRSVFSQRRREAIEGCES